MKKKKIIIGSAVIIALIIIAGIIATVINKKENSGFASIKSEKQLEEIYNSRYEEESNIPMLLATMPYSLMIRGSLLPRYDKSYGVMDNTIGLDISKSESATDSINSASSAGITSSNTKDYSTTNIQVENVDEADITKTDGNYIYSISEDKVVITNVTNPEELKVETKIESQEDYVPEDLILYGEKLVVISTHYESYNKRDTMVSIYDISNKSEPKKVEEYSMYAKYYTSRCINGKLFVISSSKLRKEDDRIVTYYNENNRQKEIELERIKYLKGMESKDQTLISSIDLNKMENVKMSMYLFNVENAYISENSIYLLNSDYKYNKYAFLDYMKVLAKKGVIGYVKELIDGDLISEYGEYTTIYKFEILEDGSLQYKNKTEEKGATINQFSLDEFNENLRVALSGSEGSRIVVFDKKLNKIGETENLSKGEKMYSTRFMGNKAYMVTYKNTDPLYVIDLSNPSTPEVLGKLKIPGYSTYLHPYDENHLIGIGMQTKEKVYKDSQGRVTRTTAVITGMKMALFDVSDVNNPKQISQTIIGDRRTTSAILTNHKALLFSKEKGILAIPVNSYPSDFEINSDTTDINFMVKAYSNYGKKYTKEGYFVYNINLEDGIKLKGIINHDKTSVSNYYYSTSRLIRGIWIENNLFTISEDMIKVNNLEDLNQIAELNIKKAIN